MVHVPELAVTVTTPVEVFTLQAVDAPFEYVMAPDPVPVATTVTFSPYLAEYAVVPNESELVALLNVNV
jgi:hypothetical protein